MEKARLIIIISILTILIAASFVVAVNYQKLDNKNYYSYTTAVCSGNSCADFLVECNGNEIVSNSQITGWVTFSENWEDPRGEDKKHLCD